jgi:hypothetical protein
MGADTQKSGPFDGEEDQQDDGCGPGQAGIGLHTLVGRPSSPGADPMLGLVCAGSGSARVIDDHEPKIRPLQPSEEGKSTNLYRSFTWRAGSVITPSSPCACAGRTSTVRPVRTVEVGLKMEGPGQAGRHRRLAQQRR